MVGEAKEAARVAIVMTADQELALAAAEADTKRKNPGTVSGALWGVVRKTQWMLNR